MTKTICALLFFCLLTSNLSAQLLINEVMQSNIDCIMDDLNEFPDSWIELYNSGDAELNLKDYKVGISEKVEDAYSLPDYLLVPKGFKLVYCDKYEGNRDWHAPFRLESGKGGAIYLFKKNELVDSIVDMKKQPAPNIAYGRKTDGANKFGYQAYPTPEISNCGKVYGKDDILPEPLFSLSGQIFESVTPEKMIEISIPEGAPEGTKIVFTIDGKEPSENSTVYKDPIKLVNNLTIRAKLVCDGYLSPRSITQSYIFLDREMTMPVISLVTDSDYFYDSRLGIYTYENNNAANKNDWRRPLNIEYFAAPYETSKINQLGEARVAGGASRNAVYKTLVLYANKRFSENKRFSYEFFPEDRPGITEFKSLMLRNSGNDFDYIYMRDAIMQRSFAWHTDIDFQAYCPAVVFLNGNYLCMLNIRERSNEDNIYTNYDKLEDIDMFENWWELKTGKRSNRNAFENFYKELGHSREEYEEWMDTEEFMNIMIMNIFYSNRDFPGNNIVMWRPSSESGRWRWIAKDTDLGLGLYGHPFDYKTINWIFDHNYDPEYSWANSENVTRLFSRLMDDPNFRKDFIDRCAIYMGDFLNFDHIWEEMWSSMYERIKVEYPIHRRTVNSKWPIYSETLEKAKNWLKNRPDFFYDHLSEYFSLGRAIPLKINQGLSEIELSEIEVEMNGVKLSKNKLDGKFFQGREICLSGRHINSWEVTIIDNNGTIEKFCSDGSDIVFNLPECSSISIESILGDPEYIKDTYSNLSNNVLGIYGLNGVRQQHLQKGNNIVIMRDGSTKKVRW